MKYEGHEIPDYIYHQFQKGAECRGKKGRKIPWNVTPEYLWNLFVKQDGKCELSGVDLTLDYPRTASLDRTDSSKGYLPGNVQWVHCKLNRMKLAMPMWEVREWCRKIVVHELNKKFGPGTDIGRAVDLPFYGSQPAPIAPLDVTKIPADRLKELVMAGVLKVTPRETPEDGLLPNAARFKPAILRHETTLFELMLDRAPVGMLVELANCRAIKPRQVLSTAKRPPVGMDELYMAIYKLDYKLGRLSLTQPSTDQPFAGAPSSGLPSSPSSGPASPLPSSALPQVPAAELK